MTGVKLTENAAGIFPTGIIPGQMGRRCVRCCFPVVVLTKQELPYMFGLGDQARQLVQ